MIFLPDFFQRIQASLIGLRLPVSEVAGLLMDIYFGDNLGDVHFHRAIVRQIDGGV
jgi:hypothetical protein